MADIPSKCTYIKHSLVEIRPIVFYSDTPLLEEVWTN